MTQLFSFTYQLYNVSSLDLVNEHIETLKLRVNEVEQTHLSRLPQGVKAVPEVAKQEMCHQATLKCFDHSHMTFVELYQDVIVTTLSDMKTK